MANLYIGTSGFTYKEWRDKFYPKGVAQKNWLEYYSRRYNSVEINASFYRIFPDSVTTHWREVTPEGFKFVLKAPRSITHEKAMQDIGVDLGEFTASALGLREKLGAALWQFPPSATAEELGERFERFLSILPNEMRHVFEFRHPSWFSEDIYALLDQYNAGFVVSDSRQFPTRGIVSAGLMYIRFHGPGKMYDSRYTTGQLQAWADTIQPQMAGRETYLFFNNTASGQALENANEMRAMLAAQDEPARETQLELELA